MNMSVTTIARSPIAQTASRIVGDVQKDSTAIAKTIFNGQYMPQDMSVADGLIDAQSRLTQARIAGFLATINDGQSLIARASSIANAKNALLNQMIQLATKAQDATLTDAQRVPLDTQFTNLIAAINAITMPAPAPTCVIGLDAAGGNLTIDIDLQTIGAGPIGGALAAANLAVSLLRINDLATANAALAAGAGTLTVASSILQAEIGRMSIIGSRLQANADALAVQSDQVALTIASLADVNLVQAASDLRGEGLKSTVASIMFALDAKIKANEAQQASQILQQQ